MSKLIGTFRDLPHKLHLSSGGKAKASDKQLKQYKEFFDLGELCKVGFPDNATTIAYDSQLSLLAVGTKTGEILIFGAPGHEFSACHKEPAAAVKQLLFLPEEGRLVSLTSDNRLHKWELNAPDAAAAPAGANWRLEHVADLLAGPADGADGQTAACVALVGGDRLWVGYDSGSVRVLDTKEWKFTEAATSGEAIAKGLTEEATSQVHGWGALVAMEASPASGKQVALGFASGTVAVLNSADCSLHSVAPGSSELRCLNWQTDGSGLYTGHADGSYAVWRASEPAEASRLLKPADNPQTVYGPFPCLPVTRLLHRTAKLGGLTVLAGGMAKNTHADRHTVTLLREQEHVCLDLCSPVVDLALLCSPGDGNTGQAGYDEPHTLLVLCESQLVAIDLYGAQWPEYRPPYLTALSATGAPVTAARLYGSGSAAAEQLRVALLTASAAAGVATAPNGAAYSSRAWPITGGKSLVAAAAEAKEDETPAAAEAPAAATQPTAWDLLVTGHADGSVAFWQVGSAGGGTSAALLHTLHTADVFADAPARAGDSADVAADANGGGGFPPFRPAGRRWRRPADEADADAGRFAVTAFELAGDSLLVGGAAGQATLWRLVAAAPAAPVEVDVRTVNADMVPPPSNKDSPYAWEGRAPLRVREDPWQPAPQGQLFEPATIALAFPPDRVRSLALDVGHGLAAVGTGFGLALVDTGANRCLATHCTLPPTPTASHATASAEAGSPAATPAKGATGATASGSGGSSITKSLRQSFRRLKKLRGGKRQEYTVTAEEAADAAGAGAGPSTSAETQEAASPTTEEAGASASDKKKKDKKEKEKKKDNKKEKKTEEKKVEEKKAEEKAEVEEKKAEENAEVVEGAASAAPAEVASPPPEPIVVKQQKQPLTMATADESAGRVRCLLIADSHLLTAGASTPTVFAGDYAGRVYAFVVESATAAAAAADAGDAGRKQARLAKELHLRHGAPVVAMHVTGEQQQLVVASEQQVKLFGLPSLRPRCKARLLPAEAPARLRACGLAQFRGPAAAAAAAAGAAMSGLAVEDSLGRLLVLGLPQLKILAQLDRPAAAAAAASAGCLAFQPAGAANSLAVAVAGATRVRLVRLAPAPAVDDGSVRYVAPAGVNLPEWARPAKTTATAAAATTSAQASPAASAAAAASDSPAAAAQDETAHPTAEEEVDGAESQLPPTSQEGDADRSHQHHVAADITMDDIKEYAAPSTLPPTDTIPESTDEKQEPAATPAAAAAAATLDDGPDQQAVEEAVVPPTETDATQDAAKTPATTTTAAEEQQQEQDEVKTTKEADEPELLKPAEVKAACDEAATIAAGDVATEQ